MTPQEGRAVPTPRGPTVKELLKPGMPVIIDHREHPLCDGLGKPHRIHHVTGPFKYPDEPDGWDEEVLAEAMRAKSQQIDVYSVVLAAWDAQPNKRGEIPNDGWINECYAQYDKIYCLYGFEGFSGIWMSNEADCEALWRYYNDDWRGATGHDDPLKPGRCLNDYRREDTIANHYQRPPAAIEALTAPQQGDLFA